MFIILNWFNYQNVVIVTKKDGTPKLFKSSWKAEKYAKKNLNFKWQIVFIA